MLILYQQRNTVLLQLIVVDVMCGVLDAEVFDIIKIVDHMSVMLQYKTLLNSLLQLCKIFYDSWNFKSVIICKL